MQELSLAFRIMIAVSTLAVLVALRMLFDNYSLILANFTRKKVSYDFEYRWQLGRARNIEALLLLVPFGLTLHCGLPHLPMWGAYLVAVAYVLLRRGVAALVRPRRLQREWRNALVRSLYTFFIPTSLLVIVTSGVRQLLPMTAETFGSIVLVELALLFLAVMVSDWRILRQQYSIFATFLYFCALEILPLGLCAAAVVRL